MRHVDGRALRFTRPFSRRRLCAGAGLALVTASSAAAQGNGFLFERPLGSLSIRGGYAMANAGSDVFSFAREQLTLGARSFDAAAIGADLGFRVHDRVDIVFSY